MPITRSAAVTHLDNQFDVIDAAVGTNLAAYGSDIDQALRRMGVAESSLPTATIADEDRGAFLALAEYYALRRFSRKLALKVNFSVDGQGSSSEKQMFDNVKVMMDEVKDTCAGFGYPVDEMPSWSMVSLNLDFIEPEAT